jgi:hypothetical protein
MVINSYYKRTNSLNCSINFQSNSNENQRLRCHLSSLTPDNRSCLNRRIREKRIPPRRIAELLGVSSNYRRPGNDRRDDDCPGWIAEPLCFGVSIPNNSSRRVAEVLSFGITVPDDGAGWVAEILSFSIAVPDDGAGWVAEVLGVAGFVVEWWSWGCVSECDDCAGDAAGDEGWGWINDWSCCGFP